MAFTDFKSIEQVQKQYNIRYTEEIFIQPLELAPSPAFLEEYEFSSKYVNIFASEVARCENIIYPVLRDVFKHHVQHVALWSHKALSYDNVLSGIPDYLITSKSSLGKTVLGLPVVVTVEAKRNDFEEGWGQCLAEMLAAQKLNDHAEIPVYGVVTDGDMWQFGKLIDDVLTKNKDSVNKGDLSEIFAALNYIISDSAAYLSDLQKS